MEHLKSIDKELNMHEKELVFNLPAEELLDFYLDFCRETWGHAHEDYILNDPAQFDTWRKTIVRTLADQAAGINLPPGFVPSVRYWITQNMRCIAVADIRVKLTPALEVYGGQLGLLLRPSERGKGYGKVLFDEIFHLGAKLGLGETLVTTTSDNTAMRKILAKPEFLIKSDEIDTFVNGETRRICRYYYDLSRLAQKD